MTTLLVEPDDRGRVSLARAGALAERYLVHRTDSGVIVLEPAVVVGEREVEGLRKAREARDSGGETMPLREASRRARSELGLPATRPDKAKRNR